MQYQGSIRKKLILIILLVSAVTSFVGYSSFVYWYMKNQDTQSIKLSKTAGDIIAQDIAKLILLNDISAAADISMKLRSFKNLNKMILYKKNSSAIFQYSRDNKKFKVDPLPKNIKEIPIHKTNDSLTLFTKAIYQENHFGYIKLEFSLDSAFKVVKGNLKMLLFTLLFMIIFSLILATFYSKQFTEPILDLVSFLAKIIKFDSLEKRIYTSEKNEFGILYTAINTMLQRIQQSQQTIKIAATTFETLSGMSITNKDGIILQVNQSYTKITGYKSKEILGKKSSILKSGVHDDIFYKNMYKALEENRFWSGEITNKHKNGELFTVFLTIQAVLDKNNVVEYFVASFVDTTLQKKIEKMLMEKEIMLIQQSKMASMGEMLENIAHQWRQPLSVISTIATGQLAKKHINIPISDEEEIEKYMKINATVQHLSQTIDDFRNFFNPYKTKKEFHIRDSYQKTLNLVNSKFSFLGIEVIENIEDIKITNLENELIQVLMNILSNAKDILEEKANKDEKLIFVEISKSDTNVIINITDNGGGIPKNIQDRVFEPYFSTKHKKQGTGIGLYMCKEMVEKHIGGTISVENTSVVYNDKEYYGAKFTIIIPLESKSE